MNGKNHLCSYVFSNGHSQPDNCGLEDILESSHDGLFITDGDGNVEMANSAWERICGIPNDFVIGKNVRDLVKQKFYTQSSVQAAIEARKKMTIMLEMTKGEKIGQKIMATAIPIWDENGNIRRVVANIRDITEILYLKELLEKTRQLNEIYAAEIEQMRFQQITKNNDIIARSSETKRILEMAAQVAKVDSSVLITGESGVGKEVVANTIHRLGPRSQGPLIKINCSAIPESLLESELFGYEEGAFTGAKKQGKPGMFEMANKGTLFLDEIGDISCHLQAKLLRALQEHEIMRVGGLKPICVDARIIAATNRNLKEMVNAKSFREDLYYRLNVVAIEIPPLRKRKEDIPLLVQHFVKKINEKYQFAKRVAPEILDSFMLYSWPGNIRELENVIERMLVMTEGEQINALHLPIYIRNQVYPGSDNVVLYDNIPFKRAMERAERQLLEQAVKKHGSTSKVSKALRIDQSTVVRKIKKYGLATLCHDMDEPENPFEDVTFRI